MFNVTMRSGPCIVVWLGLCNLELLSFIRLSNKPKPPASLCATKHFHFTNAFLSPEVFQLTPTFSTLNIVGEVILPPTYARRISATPKHFDMAYNPYGGGKCLVSMLYPKM